LLRKLGGRQLHRATDRDVNNAFVLINPSVRVQRFLRVFLRGLEIFHPLLRPRLFIVTSARHGPNDREHDYAEQCEEKDYPQPRG